MDVAFDPTESRSRRSAPLPGDLHSVGRRQGVPSGNVGFVPGFVADDSPAPPFKGWSTSAIMASGGAGRSGAISKLA
jgi:hypothetical protein